MFNLGKRGLVAIGGISKDTQKLRADFYYYIIIRKIRYQFCS